MIAETTSPGLAYNITASKEVILSAGTIRSAQLLQLSGIGNAALLSTKGIKVKYNNPNVGLNLAVRPFDQVGIVNTNFYTPGIIQDHPWVQK